MEGPGRPWKGHGRPWKGEHALGQHPFWILFTLAAVGVRFTLGMLIMALGVGGIEATVHRRAAQIVLDGGAGAAGRVEGAQSFIQLKARARNACQLRSAQLSSAQLSKEKPRQTVIKGH